MPDWVLRGARSGQETRARCVSVASLLCLLSPYQNQEPGSGVHEGTGQEGEASSHYGTSDKYSNFEKQST